jgi:hypothetical protein
VFQKWLPVASERAELARLAELEACAPRDENLVQGSVRQHLRSTRHFSHLPALSVIILTTTPTVVQHSSIPLSLLELKVQSLSTHLYNPLPPRRESLPPAPVLLFHQQSPEEEEFRNSQQSDHSIPKLIKST